MELKWSKTDPVNLTWTKAASFDAKPLFYQQHNCQYLKAIYGINTFWFVFWRLVFAANEIYCLTAKTNGDAAVGKDRIIFLFLDNEEPPCLGWRRTDSSR